MITIKVDKQTLETIHKDYKNYIVEENVGYILFCAKKDSDIITAYANKKNSNFKVTIQSDDYLTIAQKYSKSEIILPKKEKHIIDNAYFIDIDEQIGSDEVGTGDFLAPIVVCAAYVDHNTMKIINDYGIKDSKKLTDKQILEIVPLLIKKVYYEYKILSNERYNAAILKGYNINKIKAVLHNACLTNLKKRFPCASNIYVDQFVEADKYYSYLTNIDHVTDGIVFRTKGESYFPSVALASCISRYYLLKEVEFFSEKIGFKIQLGAGQPADECAEKLIKTIGPENFAKCCKQNFKNYDDIRSKFLNDLF